MAFEAGQFASDYEILGELGKGGMGRVYRVRNVISNRVEAMKVLLADVASEADLGDRFIGEIRTLARLDHPNIAKFHTAFRVENQLVMVMEFVEGVTLSERAVQGPLTLNETIGYITQTLAALGYAHQNGVIHRDIKPSNIMVTPHGVAKLMDFGIAKSQADPLRTRPGTTMGSMLYMSPEQVRGTGVDGRSDLYSVGILLYELTAGKRPFEGENTFAILDAHLNAPPPPLLELNPALPKALNEIVLTALEKEPMRRFQTAEAFQNALASLRSQERPAPQAGRAAGAVAPAAAVASARHRGLWMAVGATACVAVLAGGIVALPHFFHSAAASQPVRQAVESPAQSAPQSPPQAAPVSPVVEQSKPAPETATPTQQTQGKPVVVRQPRDAERPTIQEPVQAVTTQQTPAVQPEAKPAGPSTEEIEAAQDSLMKLHSRADAVRSSLENMKAQQAASGLSIRQDMAAAASRMDNYLGSCDRAMAGQDLAAAQKNMQRAEDEISKLEAFFGR